LSVALVFVVAVAAGRSVRRASVLWLPVLAAVIYVALGYLTGRLADSDNPALFVLLLTDIGLVGGLIINRCSASRVSNG
jgi:hypothetical protein